MTAGIATPLGGRADDEITVLKIEFTEKQGDSRFYELKGSRTLDAESAGLVRQAFSTPGVKPPALLDVIVDYFAVRIGDELFYVVEMQERGFQITRARMSGDALERVEGPSRVIGKHPKLKELLQDALDGIEDSTDEE
ncbi:hypothetical protein HAHE_08680 [Haloferula helveola]|uniref:Uncharacterized protein n=2 Tax=Haloferula helveola TaxID=490095 RepID=A0ABN6H092_9BACT|nr:hypothetical protein HAHE_08680 [Haloferula helveola]